MWDKCTNSCVCLLIIFGLVLVFVYDTDVFSPSFFQEPRLTFLDLEVQCHFYENLNYAPRKIPTMKSFIPASTTGEGQELLLSGLVLVSTLANACQPLADVSKAKIQINKIALINFANENECSLQDLLVHAQNAGYSVVIFIGFYCPSGFNTPETDLQDKLLIPVLCVNGRC